MKVFKVFVDLDKEEKYLCEMAEKGYLFVKYSYWGVYTFEPTEPKTLNYRVDYRYFSSKAQFEEYVTLFEDSGWEHIYGTQSSGSQYFIPKQDANQTEDIFSDRVSKADRYKRLSIICLVSACALFAVIFTTVLYTTKNIGWAAFDFHNWYLTPDLWEKTGSDFWKAFLFETPVAIMRVIMDAIPTLAMLFLTVVYGCWAFKAWRLYRKQK
jgi:hypothetical protein